MTIYIFYGSVENGFDELINYSSSTTRVDVSDFRTKTTRKIFSGVICIKSKLKISIGELGLIQ